MGAGLEQELNERRDSGKLAEESIVPLARAAAAEGIVLLRHENEILPIKEKTPVAVFGRTALNYFTVGYGSGGDVRAPYGVNLVEGLVNAGVSIDVKLNATYQNWVSDPKNQVRAKGWGAWPLSLPEMPLTDNVVKKAASRNSVALVVLGRAAGESRENQLKKGSYYLTRLERKMLDQTTAHFQRVVVILNAGNIIDLSWLRAYEGRIGAVLYAWQGGMESGNALADVLTGKVNPSGKLSAAIADSYGALPSAKHFGGRKYNNYVEDIYVGYRYLETFTPESVLYPFGFGLSYTSFSVESKGEAEGNGVVLNMNIKNTGKYAGKEVVQIYLAAPQGLLGKPSRVLAAFEKTKELQPDESQDLNIEIDLKAFASYDDSGVTGYKSAYVLEKGEYTIYVGTDSRSAEPVLKTENPATVVVRQLSEVMAVEKKNVFPRLVNRNGQPVYEKVPTRTKNLKKIILDRLPMEIPQSGDDGIKLGDVAAGKATMEDFLAQLTPKELDEISRGEGEMDSPLGYPGNAGAFGGISESLRQKGIPPVITADGPSGIRIRHTAALLPSGTALASTFNLGLVTRLYTKIGVEMQHYGIDLLLAPGMNIHRNPLCGRNFEYFSEDPLLTGEMAAAVINGLQETGVAGCLKHFAGNNQEERRATNDSRVSERALREIYLKPFEIAIQKSNPLTIMTSYNKINGVWSHYNYELATTVLREEWGYEGLVITDWWLQRSVSPEFPNLLNDAYRIRSQVDVAMPGGDGKVSSSRIGRHLLDTYGERDGITLGEMQRSARNVLRFILQTKATKKKL